MCHVSKAHYSCFTVLLVSFYIRLETSSGSQWKTFALIRMLIFFNVCFLIKGIACRIIERCLGVGSWFSFPVQSLIVLSISQMPFIWVVYVLFFLIIDYNRYVCFSVNLLLLALNHWRPVIKYFLWSGLFFYFLRSIPSNTLLKSFPRFLWLMLFSCSGFSSWFPVWHNDQANIATQLYHFFNIFWWIQTESFCDCPIFCSTSC